MSNFAISSCTKLKCYNFLLYWNKKFHTSSIETREIWKLSSNSNFFQKLRHLMECSKCSFMAKWRPSWISLGGRKSWTNWPIPINLIFLSLSQHAAKNDTKYDYTFLKMEKNIFLLNALSGHFGFWKVADPRGVSNQFFLHILELYIKREHLSGNAHL